MTAGKKGDIDAIRTGRLLVEMQRKNDEARGSSLPGNINIRPPAHIGSGTQARPVDMKGRRRDLTHTRRLRLLGLSIACAGIFMLLVLAMVAINANYGFEWGTAWSVVTMTLGMGAFMSGIGAVQALPRIMFRAAIPAIDGDEADQMAKASDRMTKLLLKPMADTVDADLVEQARHVVRGLARMSSVPLRSQGRHGYPPRHTTGENAVNYENDTMSEHVARVRASMSELIAHAKGREDIPSTKGEVNAMIGGVAAPLRVALRRHGIRLVDLDDDRGTTPLPVRTFGAPLPPPDPIDQIASVIGPTIGLLAIRKQRDRIARIGIDALAPEMATEARTLLDRHLPALWRQMAAAQAAAESGLDEVTLAEAEAVLTVLAEGLRAIADRHAETLRNQISDQRRFLDAREARDPLGD